MRVLLLVLLVMSSLFSHQTALSYLELDVDNEHRISVIIKKPLQDMGRADLQIRFPRRCEDIRLLSRHQESKYLITKRVLWCGEDGLIGSTIRVRNLLQSDKGVVFAYKSDEVQIYNRLLTAYDPSIMIEKSAHSGGAFSYIFLGVEHILMGVDHLLFVLALLLIVSNIKLLMQTITAFTFSHSLTLGLATLGIVDFSQSYIEAMIALSIIFLARELLYKDKHTLSYTKPWLVALGFGLLHGLGFATALSEVGLPSAHLVLSLLYFNLGVEIGQILFIFSVLIIIRVFKSVSEGYHNRIKKVTVYMIGVVSSYWFIERLLLMF